MVAASVSRGPDGRAPPPRAPASGELADELRVLGVRGEQRLAVPELEVGEVEPGRDDAAHERPGAVRRQVRAAREAGALPAAGRHQRLRQPVERPLGQPTGKSSVG